MGYVSQEERVQRLIRRYEDGWQLFTDKPVPTSDRQRAGELQCLNCNNTHALMSHRVRGNTYPAGWDVVGEVAGVVNCCSCPECKDD